LKRRLSEMSTDDKDSKIPAVQLQDINGKNVPATTSLAIAEFTGLLHKNILQSIDNLISTGKFNELNFQPVEYKDKKGELRRSYILDETLTSVVIMRSKSDKALDWQLAYVDEFKRMRSALSDTKYIRKKGDEFALADKMQKMALLNERRRAGKSTETDHFALINISKATNRLAFGVHEKDMRQNMKQFDALKLSKSLELTYREILNGNIEVKEIEQTVKPLIIEEAKKLK
jgi:Rha family phage regulatory protein